MADPVPAVSIVVPTKNRRQLLLTTLAGILAQQDVSCDVVVVDDGSTDGTGEAIAALADPRIRVLPNPASQGVVAARNRGLAAARADWVAFCDDDDLWAPGKLAAQIAAAGATGRGWAVAGALGFEPDGRVRYATLPASGAELAARLPWVNGVPGGCSNVVARRRLLEATGGFDPRLRVLADWELWIRLARHGPPAAVASPLVGYRLHGSNMSTRSDGVLEEMRLVETLSADLRGGRRLDAAWFHRWMGSSMLRGGDRRGAAAAYSRAASVRHPSPAVRSLACLVVPASGWALARRLKARRAAELPPPPWLSDLLAQEEARRRGSPPGP